MPNNESLEDLTKPINLSNNEESHPTLSQSSSQPGNSPSPKKSHSFRNTFYLVLTGVIASTLLYALTTLLPLKPSQSCDSSAEYWRTSLPQMAQYDLDNNQKFSFQELENVNDADLADFLGVYFDPLAYEVDPAYAKSKMMKARRDIFACLPTEKAAGALLFMDQHPRDFYFTELAKADFSKAMSIINAYTSPDHDYSISPSWIYYSPLNGYVVSDVTMAGGVINTLTDSSLKNRILEELKKNNKDFYQKIQEEAYLWKEPKHQLYNPDSQNLQL